MVAVTVIGCASAKPADKPLPHLNEKRPYDHVMVGQMVLGQAAFLIEHPNTAPADQATYTSVLVAAIRAYRTLVALHPEEKRAEWDQLDAAERNSQLSPYVMKATTACPKPWWRRQPRELARAVATVVSLPPRPVGEAEVVEDPGPLGIRNAEYERSHR